MPYCGKNGLLTNPEDRDTKRMYAKAMYDKFVPWPRLLTHKRHFLHMDPKPENVFYCGGNWLLADLGNAEYEHRVRDNHVHYTCYYRCPLAALGIANKNTDIFAMTLCIRELITGYPIYKNSDEDCWDFYAKHLNRTDMNWFLQLLDKKNAAKLIMLTNTITFTGIPAHPEPTPFFALFDQLLQDNILNFLCSGGSCFYSTA